MVSRHAATQPDSDQRSHAGRERGQFAARATAFSTNQAPDQPPGEKVHPNLFRCELFCFEQRPDRIAPEVSLTLRGKFKQRDDPLRHREKLTQAARTWVSYRLN
ncbi:hypothetical protein Lesp02_10790 [Lentzea sp. NBRC 105346]|nr:hypothetical protein Lesp02_10790 [Lentzea sp. NBRC 105346]